MSGASQGAPQPPCLQAPRHTAAHSEVSEPDDGIAGAVRGGRDPGRRAPGPVGDRRPGDRRILRGDARTLSCNNKVHAQGARHASTGPALGKARLLWPGSGQGMSPLARLWARHDDPALLGLGPYVTNWLYRILPRNRRCGVLVEP